MLYRAYIVGEDGHYVRVHEFESDSDEKALSHAREFVDGCDVELRHRGRLISRLTRADGESADT
jgi:hypothetical protein